MSAHPIAIQSTGLVTAVGLSAPASCAAFRAKITHPTETRFIDSGGEWIMAHQVQLEQPWRGLTRLAKMAAMAIAETLHDIPRKEWSGLPVLLCVAETERPGRIVGLEDRLLSMIQTELGVTFAGQSAVIPQGRVGVALALAQARELMSTAKLPRVLVAATDSLLSWPTLSYFESADRLLTERNSNGFMPGEGSGALLIGGATGRAGEVICNGIGFGHEDAHLDSGAPLRADGLSHAVRLALAESGCEMHNFDYRITDLSGEQYYFKEAALALGRTLRQRKETFEIWHPAESTGETGAAAGVVIIALAYAACRKAFSLGPNILVHMANDSGQRAALSLRYRAAE
jgi:3-oxoacyl-[acyl-carrier-protein] synthase I